VENSLWKNLRTPLKTEGRIKEYAWISPTFFFLISVINLSFPCDTTLYLRHKDKKAKSENIQTNAISSYFGQRSIEKYFHTVYSLKRDTAVLALQIHESLVILWISFLHFSTKFHCNIKTFSTSFYLLSLRSKCSSWHPILKHTFFGKKN